MQGVLNESAFSSEKAFSHWKFMARGGSAHGVKGGIHDPNEVKIRRGSTLFRIGHSLNANGRVSDAINLSSPWWMTDEDFLDLCHSVQTIGSMDLQTLGRYKLSVKEAYGQFDTVFQVETLGALGAFCGYGNPVFEKVGAQKNAPVRALAWPGHPIRQYFIPGLRNWDGQRTDLSDRAFVPRPPVRAYKWLANHDRILNGRRPR
jgi:hypothetical protein